MKKLQDTLLQRFRQTRQASLVMCQRLSPEQCRIQPMAEASPPWWNLAHTSWFFVRNVINVFNGKKILEDELFDYVLNSYYISLGPRLDRDRRGLMTRPTMQEVYDYRRSVDERVEELISTLPAEQLEKCASIIEIGCQHEQQHQELFYTEIKYILYQNPLSLRQAYCEQKKVLPKETHTLSGFSEFKEGVYECGNLEGEWGWDNEYPIHKHYLTNFCIANRLITNREYLEFIDDGGYKNALLWLSNGWNKANQENWQAPLYWEKIDGEWHIWTLSGMQKLNLEEPVCHVSFYEAEAFSTWKKKRLPTEREWELAARQSDISNEVGNFLDSGYFQPVEAENREGLTQMLGDVWEWTVSFYEAYPGYKPYPGNLGEYNEKFMDNQRVLRGGSCVSERNHIRISYRNFWPPETRFQFSGFRLAD